MKPSDAVKQAIHDQLIEAAGVCDQKLGVQFSERLFHIRKLFEAYEQLVGLNL